jgi:hypothetical protein
MYVRVSLHNVLYNSALTLVRLFNLNFFVCTVENIVRYLVIYQIAFYNVESTKKFSLKRNFYEIVFTCFFN